MWWWWSWGPWMMVMMIWSWGRWYFFTILHKDERIRSRSRLCRKTREICIVQKYRKIPKMLPIKTNISKNHNPMNYPTHELMICSCLVHMSYENLNFKHLTVWIIQPHHSRFFGFNRKLIPKPEVSKSMCPKSTDKPTITVNKSVWWQGVDAVGIHLCVMKKHTFSKAFSFTRLMRHIKSRLRVRFDYSKGSTSWIYNALQWARSI